MEIILFHKTVQLTVGPRAEEADVQRPWQVYLEMEVKGREAWNGGALVRRSTGHWTNNRPFNPDERVEGDNKNSYKRNDKCQTESVLTDNLVDFLNMELQFKTKHNVLIYLL